MTFAIVGESTSPAPNPPLAEVTQISSQGVWVLVLEEELFLPFENFPWFKAATIGQVQNVEFHGPDHLHWPDLDIDLSLSAIRDPNAFPLVSQAGVISS